MNIFMRTEFFRNEEKNKSYRYLIPYICNHPQSSSYSHPPHSAYRYSKSAFPGGGVHIVGSKRPLDPDSTTSQRVTLNIGGWRLAPRMLVVGVDWSALECCWPSMKESLLGAQLQGAYSYITLVPSDIIWSWCQPPIQHLKATMHTLLQTHMEWWDNR